MSLQKLPHELWYSSENRSIKVPVKVCQEYEAKVASLAERIRQRSPPERRLISTHSLLVAQRVLWICTAAMSDNLGLFLLVGSLQFLVAPYSFAISILMWTMHTSVHCLGHFCSALVIHFLPVTLPSWDVEINNQFIILFLALDFLVTAYFVGVEYGWLSQAVSFAEDLTSHGLRDLQRQGLSGALPARMQRPQLQLGVDPAGRPAGDFAFGEQLLAGVNLGMGELVLSHPSDAAPASGV